MRLEVNSGSGGYCMGVLPVVFTLPVTFLLVAILRLVRER